MTDKDTIYQMNDAMHDMLKGLNFLTDKENPTYQQVCQMGILSKAIKDLQEAQNMHMAMHEGMEEMASKKA